MQAISNDEEHARLLVEASAKSEAEPYAPPMATWSAEAELLANLIDEVRVLRTITVAVNSSKAPKQPMPYPRPKTVMDKVRHQSRQAKHEALAARMLPHKN